MASIGCSEVLHEKLISFLRKMKEKIRKVAEEDPRRMVHSFKVAFAITLVSMIYYLRPFYKGMGDAGMWAILTVVVVFEYTVGATLSKGMNRGFATLLAGALGVGAESLADLFGPTVEPIVLGCLVFFIVALATFSRFVPNIKKRYDYGVLIFILTFTLVSVSGYRAEKIIELAHQRFSTIILGGATCIIVSVFVCPVWAGEDLHNLIILNLEKLGNYLEGFGGEYYEVCVDGDGDEDKSYLSAYKSVLGSKATEESLACFAWWEPAHGKFKFRHPWKQYLKIGALTRQSAYHVEALNNYLHSKNNASSEFKRSLQEPCMKISSEAGKALKEIAKSIKSTSYPSSLIIQNCKKTVDEMKTTLKEASMARKQAVLEIVPVIAVTSILIDIIKCIESISEAVEELSKQAHFKKSNEKGKSKFIRRASIKVVNDEDGGFVAVIVHEMGTDLLENGKSQELKKIEKSIK